MGYTIQYGGYPHDKKSSFHKKFWNYSVLILTVVIVIISLCFPNEISEVRYKVFPIFRPEVLEAFHEMITQMGKGISVSEATASFCREIVFYNEN